MQAVIFDIDGTLLPSAAVDNDLYKEAVRSVLRDAHTTVTDPGIEE